MPFYLSDYFLGARTLYKELVEIFSVPAERGYLNLELAGNDYRPAVDFLNEFGFPFVIAEGEDVDFEAYVWTLEHISPAEGVNYEVEPIEYLDRGMSALEHQTIRILHGFWVKPQHLELMLSAESIQIEDSSFTGADINEFLHRLKGGSNPNLKEAQMLLCETYDEEEALDGRTTRCNQI
ncbi:hypothetical protein CAEBREN_08476 [Caenorhabditis brenneri]|uniref:Sdz-33 F-box domain-containing protein n=1 Tax=Caenorhabditis brenneri TaxID=135651 RepID=G0NTR8_CAEBE|nr:hypothetical protein CAEBREN_08476 [Caenorhabditis brenneri]